MASPNPLYALDFAVFSVATFAALVVQLWQLRVAPKRPMAQTNMRRGTALLLILALVRTVDMHGVYQIAPPWLYWIVSELVLIVGTNNLSVLVFATIKAGYGFTRRKPPSWIFKTLVIAQCMVSLVCICLAVVRNATDMHWMFGLDSCIMSAYIIVLTAAFAIQMTSVIKEVQHVETAAQANAVNQGAKSHVAVLKKKRLSTGSVALAVGLFLGYSGLGYLQETGKTIAAASYSDPAVFGAQNIRRSLFSTLLVIGCSTWIYITWSLRSAQVHPSSKTGASGFGSARVLVRSQVSMRNAM